MTNFEHHQSLSLDELALWFHKHGQFDGSPWMTWFNDNYCSKCESVKCKYIDAEHKLGIKPFYKHDIECAYCELEKQCKFFPDMDDIPDNLDIIKMWLSQEVSK
jgi:hypothetical protein